MNMDAFLILKNRIASYRTRKKTAFLLEHSLEFVFYVVVVLISLPLAYSIGKSDPIFRWLTSFSIGFLTLYYGWKKVVRPLLQLLVFKDEPSIDQTALEIGNAFSAIKDELSNAVQLLQDEKNRNNPFAITAFDKIVERTRDVNFSKIISWHF